MKKSFLLLGLSLSLIVACGEETIVRECDCGQESNDAAVEESSSSLQEISSPSSLNQDYSYAEPALSSAFQSSSSSSMNEKPSNEGSENECAEEPAFRKRHNKVDYPIDSIQKVVNQNGVGEHFEFAEDVVAYKYTAVQPRDDDFDAISYDVARARYPRTVAKLAEENKLKKYFLEIHIAEHPARSPIIYRLTPTEVYINSMMPISEDPIEGPDCRPKNDCKGLFSFLINTDDEELYDAVFRPYYRIEDLGHSLYCESGSESSYVF